MRNIPLNVRGGRAPQVGDRTFEGRTGSDGGPPPDQFTAIAWSPGPFPNIELWCYRTVTSVPMWKYAKVNPPNVNSLWLDSIPVAEGFSPPPGHAPDSEVTKEALIEYATLRFMAKYQQQRQASSGWVVQVARPFPSDFGNVARKIAYTGPNGAVYEVSQAPAPGSAPWPLAYVWVTKQGGREVWLMFEPEQPGGFRVVGNSAAPEFMESTQLIFRNITATPLWGSDSTTVPPCEEENLTANYADAICGFRKTALAQPDCPAYDPEQLVVHDWRVKG